MLLPNNINPVQLALQTAKKVSPQVKKPPLPSPTTQQPQMQSNMVQSQQPQAPSAIIDPLSKIGGISSPFGAPNINSTPILGGATPKEIGTTAKQLQSLPKQIPKTGTFDLGELSEKEIKFMKAIKDQGGDLDTALQFIQEKRAEGGQTPKKGNFIENLGSGIAQRVASYGNLGKKAGMYVGNKLRPVFGKDKLTPEQLQKAGEADNIANRITNRQTPEQKASVGGQIGNVVGTIGQALVMPTGVGSLSKIPAVASVSAKAPIISGMIKGGLQGAIGQEQYNLATEGRLSSKGELGLSAGIGATLPLVGPALSKVPVIRQAFSKSLKEGARTSVSKALAPTTKKYKQMTEKITDQFLDEGLRGSLETLLDNAKEGVEKFGAKIDDAIANGALDNVQISVKPLKELLQEAKASTMVGGNIVNKTKYAVIDGLDEMLTPFQDTIGGTEARRFKQILDEVVYSTKGGLGVEDMTYKNILSKGMADSLRSQLSKASPDLASLNKKFSFYKRLEEIIQATITRKKPQQGAVRKFIAGAFAGGQDGLINKVVSYVGGKLFLDATSSATRYTLGAKAKNKLADAIATGSPKVINATVNELNKKYNLTLPYYNEGTVFPGKKGQLGNTNPQPKTPPVIRESGAIGQPYKVPKAIENKPVALKVNDSKPKVDLGLDISNKKIPVKPKVPGK